MVQAEAIYFYIGQWFIAEFSKHRVIPHFIGSIKIFGFVDGSLNLFYSMDKEYKSVTLPCIDFFNHYNC